MIVREIEGRAEVFTTEETLGKGQPETQVKEETGT